MLDVERFSIGAVTFLDSPASLYGIAGEITSASIIAAKAIPTFLVVFINDNGKNLLNSIYPNNNQIATKVLIQIYL